MQPPGQPEPRVLDYQTQQHQLFTLLSQTYALYFTGPLSLRVCIYAALPCPSPDQTDAARASQAST